MEQSEIDRLMSEASSSKGEEDKKDDNLSWDDV